MTSLTIPVLVLVVLAAVTRLGLPRALALGGVTAAGAAAVFGGVAVPTFYAVALAAPVALLHSVLVHDRRPSARRRLPAGVPPLIAFALVCVTVTLSAPTLFAGAKIHLPADITSQLVSGQVTNSNIAQLVYLGLGVAVVAVVGRQRTPIPGLVGLAAGGTLVLSAWRYLSQLVGVPFPEGLFDNSPFFVFIETAPGGAPRFRGILSEPASLAVTCLVVVCYTASRQSQLHGRRRVGAVVLLVVAAYLGAISTSGTFVLAAVIVVALALAVGIGRFVAGRSRPGPARLVGWLLAVLGAGVSATTLLAVVGGVVGDKVDSSSYSDRTRYDAISLRLFLDTYGVGGGLGSNRASSLLPGLLSTTGLVGTVLLAVVVVSLLWRGYAVPWARPTVWALVAVLTTKLIAGPDLSDPNGLLWLSLGVLSQAVTSSRSRAARPVTTSSPHPGGPPPRAAVGPAGPPSAERT